MSLAARRLRHHASAAESDSFTYALLQAERARTAPELGPLLADILKCLQAINSELNTARPSEAIEGKANVVARSLAADMSAILSEGWDSYFRWTSGSQFNEKHRNELATTLFQIGAAWNAVLAGDIDDIREHVETENLARRHL